MSASTQPPAESAGRQDVNDNVVLGDLNISGRDTNITNYLTGLRHLRPRPVDPDKLMPANRFVSPGHNFDKAAQAVRPHFGGTANVHIVVLLAADEYGCRSAGLRLLADSGVATNRISELLPDWDEPDVACLPEERGAGYLLNLRGVTQPLPEAFFSGLATYASTLRKAGSCMVIIATNVSWSRARASGPRPEILVVELERPGPTAVVKKYLESGQGTQDRSGWIDDEESVFHGLLPHDCAPGEAVRLASIIESAKSSTDEEALEEYRGWETHLSEEWFVGGSAGVETRAVRIAGAFLNTAPAEVVLNSADLLLAAPKISFPRREGGLLAMPDAPKRLKPAGMSFDADTGAASLVHESQGPAILRYLWTKHRQLTEEVLTQWLRDISQGPAKDHLDTLATALTQLAGTVGVTPIFDLAEGWLRDGGKQQQNLVGDLLSELAVHPALGSQVRAELATWAGGKSSPARQCAAARACSGAFGSAYPSQALTRARYILNSSGTDEARKAAINAVRGLAVDDDLAPLVVDTVVTWIMNAGKRIGTDQEVFFDVFSVPSTAGQLEDSPLVVALTKPGEAGEAIRQRVFEAWQHVFQHGDDPVHAQKALLSWREGAETDRLPQQPVVDLIIRLGGSLGISGPFIKAIVKAKGPLQDALIDALFSDFLQNVEAEHDPLAEASGAEPAEQRPQNPTEVAPATQ
ncbi:hypothetical protein [Streptomyces alkaliterrae]|uniref:Uncharacterized protein n=1 Tax=Streptomyces alkaliterrae TaxID=2213162 RepID=A0A5P0YRD8_9ACTN|nr:hypothetical protein [Streptomyces alkaliterrae]MBB1257430.1 hypothetical protein [Streptomyces alkaliterrae]MQS02828.1 hypothetical protein [Streptomyces alkaliterrae]